MKCDEFKEYMVDYVVENSLQEKFLEEFEEHYFGCDKCLGELQLMSAIVGAIETEGIEGLVEGSKERIKEQAEFEYQSIKDNPEGEEIAKKEFSENTYIKSYNDFVRYADQSLDTELPEAIDNEMSNAMMLSNKCYKYLKFIEISEVTEEQGTMDASNLVPEEYRITAKPE